MESMLYHYPLDLTGRSPTNQVVDEGHLLLSHSGVSPRVVVLRHGGFYTRGLEVYNQQRDLLTPNVDYVATYTYEDASFRTGLEICGAILIINPSLSGRVYVTAQMVGGDYAFSLTVLEDVLTHLRNNPTEPVRWAGIVGKPRQYVPGELKAELWERSGYQNLTTRLEQLAQVKKTGSPEATRNYREALKQWILDYFATNLSTLDDHRNDTQNPHGTTKAHLGLDKVANRPVATVAQARAGTVDGAYMTPERIHQAIETQALAPLDHHIQQRGPIHGETAAQIGAHTKSQVDAIAATRLRKDGRAKNSLRFNNKTASEIVTLLRANLPPTAFTRGRLAPARLGLGTPGPTMVLQYSLNGDTATWTSFETLYRTHSTVKGTVVKVELSAASSVDDFIKHLNATRTSVKNDPVGTVVIFRTQFHLEYGAGNGTNIEYPPRTHAAQRFSDGWQAIF